MTRISVCGVGKARGGEGGGEGGGVGGVDKPRGCDCMITQF